MEFLRMLEGIRDPFWDFVMRAVTILGEETVFLGVVMLLFWCVDRKMALRIGIAGLASTALNILLKAIFIVPRPWVIDPTFTIVEAAREAASGYSFPSGHTQSACSLFLFLALYAKKRWQKALCLSAILLTAFSRMYLGVHTPLDVGVGLLAAAMVVLVCSAVYRKYGDQGVRMVYLGAVALSIAAFCVLYFLQPRAGQVVQFDAHMRENAWTVFGAFLGIGAYLLLEKKLKTGAQKTLAAKFVQTMLGLIAVLALKNVLKAPLDLLFVGHESANALRYCLMVLAGMLGVPILMDSIVRWRRK